VSAGWIKIYPPGAFRGRDGWHVRGRDMYGRAIEGKLPPTVTTAGAAERLGRRLLKQSNGRPPPPPAIEPEAIEDHSFNAAALAYRRIRLPRPVEWARIEKLITCPEIGPVDVAQLNTDQVATFARSTMPHNKPDTLNREIVTPYGAVLHYSYELGWRGDPKIRRFQETEDEIRAVSAADVDRLVANADAGIAYGKGAHGRVDKRLPYKVAFIEFLRLRGTRISDVLELERDRDLDLPRAQVRLVIGKSRDKVQWLPLSPKLVAMLANLAPCDGVYVFPWRSRSSVYKWWKPLCERLGLEVTPHQFRHALGEEAIDAEVDLVTLQTMGAWASLNSARRYARASRRRVEAADAKRLTAQRPAKAAPSAGPSRTRMVSG
jgi:hypothetical protein